MTVTEVATNGDRRAAAEAEFYASGGRMSIKEVAAATGLGDRQAGTVRRQWKVRLAANGGSSASGVSPPRLPAPRAIDGSVAADQRVGAARKGSPTGAQRRSRPSTRGRQRDPIKVAATGVVLAVGLAVSYSHIVHLALLAGAGWWAWVMPLPLDAMALVALLHLGTERRYPVAWAGLVVGAVGSLAANVLAVDPSLADMRYVLWGFAALPPIAVVVCGHLLDRGARR